MPKRKSTKRSGFEDAVFLATPKLRETMYESRRLPLCLPTNYLPDVILPNSLIVELKGRHPRMGPGMTKLAQVAKLVSRTKGVDSSRPNWANNFIGVAILTDKDFKMPGAKKLTVSGWAKKHGILWASGDQIPDAWFDLTSRAQFVKLVKAQKESE